MAFVDPDGPYECYLSCRFSHPPDAPLGTAPHLAAYTTRPSFGSPVKYQTFTVVLLGRPVPTQISRRFLLGPVQVATDHSKSNQPLFTILQFSTLVADVTHSRRKSSTSGAVVVLALPHVRLGSAAAYITTFLVFPAITMLHKYASPCLHV